MWLINRVLSKGPPLGSESQMVTTFQKTLSVPEFTEPGVVAEPLGLLQETIDSNALISNLLVPFLTICYLLQVNRHMCIYS